MRSIFAGCGGRSRRLQAHLVRRDRGRHDLHRRLLRPAARAVRRPAASAGRLRQRPDLRNARGVDGRVFVPSSNGGSLTAFSAGGRSSGAADRRVRLLLAGGGWRARVLRRLQRRLLRRLGAERATLWALGAGGPISGAAVVVDGVAYAGSFAHRIVGVDAASGRVVLDFPHGEYVPVSGGGHSCCFTATRVCTRSRLDERRMLRGRRRRARASGRRRRLLPPRQARLAGHPRLLDGRVRRYRSLRRSRPRPGSSGRCTAEPRVSASRRGITLAPPFRAPGRSGAQPRRVSARGRLRAALLRQQQRQDAGDHEDGRQPRLELRLGPLPGDVSRGRRHRVRDVPQPSAVQPAAGARPASSSPSTRRRGRSLAADDRPVGVLAARRRRQGVRRRLERQGLRVRRAPGASCGSTRPRQGEGRRSPSGKRLFFGDYSGHVYALDADTGSSSGRRARRRGSARPARSTRLPPSPTTASTSARPTARSTRSGRRPGSSAGRSRPAATSTPRPPSGASASTPAPTRSVLLLRRGDGQRELAVQGERPDLRLADARRRARLLRHAGGPDLRAQRDDRGAGVELPGRQVLAGRCRPEHLYLTGYARIYGLIERRR